MQLLARGFGLRTIVRQNAIQQDDFRAALRDFGLGRVECIFGRGHEKAEDQSGDGGDHAGTHFHGVLGIIAKMIIRQQATQHQTKQNSAEDAPGTD